MAEHNPFAPDKKVYSERLLGLTRHCPECNTVMHATGYMYLEQADPPWWYIEYQCPRDKELFPIYAPETNDLARQIARDLGIFDE